MVTDGTDPHVRRALEAFDDHDADGVLAEFAEGGTFTDPLEEELAGEELREYCEDLFVAFPDLRLEEKRVMTSEGGATAIECVYRGTHEGSMEGIPATGRSIAVPGVSVIATAEDGITYWRDYWDQEEFAEQLGLTFPEVLPLLPRMALAKLGELA
jgi:steroid delta-isomerase-like uncharacterized protein